MNALCGFGRWHLNLQLKENEGRSHRAVPTPSVGICGCNNEKIGGPSSISTHNPNNFTARTERKVWGDRGIMRKTRLWFGYGHDLWCFVIFHLVPLCIWSPNEHHKYYGDLKNAPSFQRQRPCACKESQPTYSSYISQHWLMHIQATPIWLEINWNLETTYLGSLITWVAGLGGL